MIVLWECLLVVVRAHAAEAASHNGDLVKSVTELIRVQMKAMITAASVQSLPSLNCYIGEGSQEEEDGIDRWLEHFDERAHLVAWADVIPAEATP